MSSNTNSRRDFMRAAAAWTAVSYGQIRGANDRVRVGLVGFSDRAKVALLPAFAKLAPAHNFALVAVSDIWKLRRDEGADFSSTLMKSQVAKARNNQELYDRKDIDAVIIATADFQHAAHGIEAVRAGCDAYIEKPLANSLEDAKAILKAVEETGRVVQIGTQRRSSKRAKAVHEYLRSKEFGDIRMAEFTSNFNQPGRWRRPALVASLRQDETDWGRFQMGRSNQPWDPRKYVEFRLFWPYSSGIADQWMVHQIDLLHMLAGVERPRSVVAQGGIYQWRDGRTNPDTLTAAFDYGSFQAVFSSRMWNSEGGTRDLYFSNAGTLDVSAGRVSGQGGLAEKDAVAAGMKPHAIAEKKLVNEGGPEEASDAALADHLRNWMECVRSRKTPLADIRAGYNHSVALCMTIAALHSGRRASYQEDRREIVLA